jgi:pimeloyl-ACP methyl ester carboxylesterase
VTHPPVVLVHGWGGSFDITWGATPLVPLLEDAGRRVVGVDLLGHGNAPKPHDPGAYADLTDRVEQAIGDEPVDAVGFSLGAMTLLRLACRRPGAFRRLVLAGIGENVLREEDDGVERIVAALEGTGDPGDVSAQAFRNYADRPGNDLRALAACLRRGRVSLSRDALGGVSCPVLVVIGEHDFAGPGEPLAEAMPDARLVVLRRVDHFATPEAFGFIDAALAFLDAVPG